MRTAPRRSAEIARQQAELALSTLKSVIFDIQDGLGRLPAVQVKIRSCRSNGV